MMITNELPPIKLVVFDMAGTTVHDGDSVNYCLAAALRRFDVHPTRDEINAIMGIEKPVAIRMLLGDNGATTDDNKRLIELIHQDFLGTMIGYYRLDQSVREVDGAEALFRELKKMGIKVALDTGFSRPIIDTILGRLGWSVGDQLDAVVGSDEVEQGRPAPDMVYRAMQLTDTLNVRSVVKVGDTPSDLLEGTAAGCGMVVGVTSGTHLKEELDPFPHTHLIESIRDLLSILPVSVLR